MYPTQGENFTQTGSSNRIPHQSCTMA